MAPQSDAGEGSSRGRCPWYSVPGLVPGVGPRLGRRATWVGASADVTYIKLDQSLINTHNLSASAVVANSNCLGEELGDNCHHHYHNHEHYHNSPTILHQLYIGLHLPTLPSTGTSPISLLSSILSTSSNHLSLILLNTIYA